MRCSWILPWLYGGAVLAADPLHTVEDIRRAHAAALDELQTGSVEYVKEQRWAPPDREMEAALARAFEVDEPPPMLRVSHARPPVLYRLRIDFDLESKIWKKSHIPTHDPEELTAILNLAYPGSATRNGSTIAIRVKEPEILTQLRVSRVEINRFGPQEYVGSPLLSTSLRFGILADSVFRDYPETTLTEVEHEGRPMLCVELRSEKSTYELVVDPEIGYRYRWLRLGAADGNVRIELTCSDYRLIDGHYFPFQYERTDYHPDGRWKSREKITVSEAHFNHKLPADVFDIDTTNDSNVLDRTRMNRIRKRLDAYRRGTEDPSEDPGTGAKPEKQQPHPR